MGIRPMPWDEWIEVSVSIEIVYRPLLNKARSWIMSTRPIIAFVRTGSTHEVPRPLPFYLPKWG